MNTEKYFTFFLGGLGSACHSLVVMNATPLDSYDNAVRTFGLTQSDYEDLMAELDAEAREEQEAAQAEFVTVHDQLGFLGDLFETFSFRVDHDANSVSLRHHELGSNALPISVSHKGDKWAVRYLGEQIGAWDTMQQVIGQILQIATWLDREDVYRDADIYGWNLPEFAGPRVIAGEDFEG